MTAPVRIVSAAIYAGGVIISLPRPARHAHVLASASGMLGPFQETQGFLTSEGRFVDRVEARFIAYRAGQNPGKSGGDSMELFSEDLW